MSLNFLYSSSIRLKFTTKNRGLLEAESNYKIATKTTTTATATSSTTTKVLYLSMLSLSSVLLKILDMLNSKLLFPPKSFDKNEAFFGGGGFLARSSASSRS